MTHVQNPLKPTGSCTKPIESLFPSTATKLDILILRQLILKIMSMESSCSGAAQSSGSGTPQLLGANSIEMLRKLDRVITTETLLDLLRPTDALIAEEPPACLLCVPTRPGFERMNPLAPDVAFVIQRLSLAFSPSEKNKHHRITFLVVVNASREDTPLLSSETLSKLSRLTTLPFVTDESVKRILQDEQFGVTKEHPRYEALHDIKEKQILDCIFYTKIGGERSTWTNADSLIDVLNSVQTKAVERLRFGAIVAAYQVEARRSVSSLLFFLVLIAVVCIALSYLDTWRLYMIGSAMSPNFNWQNYCEDGPTSECYFMQRSLLNVGTHEDVLRFVRQEIVGSLWGSVIGTSQAAADVPNGAAWLLGALLIRVAPSSASSPPQFSCGDLNLTVPYTLAVTGQTYDCGANHYLVVPFSLTADQAFAAVADFNVAAPTEDVTVVVTYPVLNPPTGAVVLNEAAMTLQQAGGVVVRARHYTIGPGLRTAVLICYVAYSLFFAVEHIFLLISQLRGLPRGFHPFFLLVKFTALALITFCYANADPDKDIEHWASDFQPRHLDVVTYRATAVQYAFGAWVLTVIASAATYLEHITIVKLVLSLISLAAAPLVATTMIVMCCFASFVSVAVFVFGSSQIEFATFVYAFRVMFPFLFGAGDSSVFTEELPVTGNIFYAVFTIATNFVALNVFNGVMMAPFGDLISSSGALWAQLQYSVEQRAKRNKSLSAFRRYLLKFRLWSLPWVNFCFDALPYPDLNWSVAMRFLDPKCSYHYLCNSAKQLYLMNDYVQEAHAKELAALSLSDRAAFKDWMHRSELYRTFRKEHKSFGMSDTSVTLITLIIAYESRFDIFRDARLAKVISLWDECNDTNARDFAPMEGWEGFDEAMKSEEDAESDTSSFTAAAEAADKKLLDDDLKLLMTLDLRPESDDDDDGSRSGSPTSPGSPTSAVELTSQNNFHDLARKQSDALEHIEFAFVKRIESQLLNAFAVAPHVSFWLQLLHVVMVVFAYIFLCVVCFSWSEASAYFTQDLHAGLRDAMYRESCNDVLCQTATTRPTTFAQGGQFSDLQNFLSLVVDDNVFSFEARPDGSPTSYLANESLPIAGVSTTPVRWSSAVRFGTLTIRHLRGAPKPCSLPTFLSTDYTSQQQLSRAARIAAMPCYSGSMLLTAPLPKSADSPLPASAYIYQDTCPDAWKHDQVGFDYTYPCAGYSTPITSSEELLYAANTWLNDPSVRFVVLSFEFYHNRSNPELPPLHTTYDMYIELGMGGGQAEFWVSTAQQSLSTTNVANKLMIIFHVHGSMIFVSFMFWLWAFGGDFNRAYRVAAPQFPALTSILTGAAVAVFYSELPTPAWASVACCCLASILFTVKFIDVVVIPLTGLISRRGTTFPRMSAYIRGRILVVVPFFAIFWVAFALGGYVMWGTNLQEYATVRQSFQTVSSGFLGGWDFDGINGVFPGLAIAETVIFFIVVPVILLPTLLSLIVQSAEDANDELAVTNEVVALADKMDARVLFGPIATFLLTVWVAGHRMQLCTKPKNRMVHWLDRLWVRIVKKLLGVSVSTNAKHTLQDALNAEDANRSPLYGGHLDDTMVLQDDANELLETRNRLRFYEQWRLPLAVECLQPYIGAARTQQLLHLLDFDHMCPTLQYTAVAFVISQVSMFKRKDHMGFASDARLESAMMKAAAAASLRAVGEL